MLAVDGLMTPPPHPCPGVAREQLLPVEAPVSGGRRQVLEHLDVEDVLDLLMASQSRRPRGAVGFGDYCCVKLLAGSFFQRAGVS